jgi:hypothetical protein
VDSYARLSHAGVACGDDCRCAHGGVGRVDRHHRSRVGTPDAGTVLAIDLAEQIPAGVDVAGVSANVTATNVTADGWALAYACARPIDLPNSSSLLNTTRGETSANHTTVSLPANDPRLCIHTTSRIDIVVDITGWWGAGSGSAGLNAYAQPIRHLDTRTSGASLSSIPAGLEVQVIDPTSKDAWFLNATVTQPGGAGWLAVYPCGEKPAEFSTVNYGPNDTRSNATVVAARQGVCVYSLVATELVIDIFADVA